MHCAALAVAAIAHYGFTLLFLSYHTDDDGSYNADKYRAYYDSPNITCYPLEHKLNSLFDFYFFSQLVRFLVGLKEHKQHKRDQQDRNY